MCMSFLVSMKLWPLTFALFFIFFSLCRSGNADDYQPETGAAGVIANQYLPSGEDANEDHQQHGYGEEDQSQGFIGEDPAHIVDKALLCFNDKHIYSSCEEDYRLSVSGKLNVPLEYTDEFCDGPCSKETHLVLSCIEGILSHFLFYNKATIDDVRETIKVGCSYGPKRGDFNVLEHIHSEEDSAYRSSYTFFWGLLLMVTICCLML